jgi:hypothetical protein
MEIAPMACNRAREYGKENMHILRFNDVPVDDD